MKLITLKITNNSDNQNYKIIQVPLNMTLYKFAEITVKAFRFNFDHAFGFYSNLKNPFQSELIHELFADMDDTEATPGSKGVKMFYMVEDLFQRNKKILFLFDYGDNWEFILEPTGEVETVFQVPKNYHKIIESHGEDPEQYPECE